MNRVWVKLTSEEGYDFWLTAITFKTKSAPSYRQHNKHALRHVEGVPPVVVDHRPVVLLDGENPADQRLQHRMIDC